MKSTYKSIPKLSKSVKRTFLGDEYRTKQEVLNAYKLSVDNSAKLSELVDNKDSMIQAYSTNVEKLEEKLSSSSMCNHSLKQNVNNKKLEISKLEKLYLLGVENSEYQREEIQKLQKNLSEVTADCAELREEFSDMKSPMSIDVLKSIIGKHADDNYLDLKEILVDFIIKDKLGSDVNYQESTDTLIKNVKKLGFELNHTMNPVDVEIKNYSLNKQRELDSAEFSFDEPDKYMNEYHKGFAQVNFKDTNSDMKIKVTHYFKPGNVFCDSLIEDSVDFGKAVLWSETIKRLDNEEYASANNIIKNNGLHELALSYASKNKDNTALLVNMKPIIDSYEK